MKGKDIVVTGAAGFIGSALCSELERENRLIAVDKRACRFNGSIREDIRKKSALKNIKKADYIFHLASVVGVDYVSLHPKEVRDTELQGIRNTAELAKKTGAKLVYASTSSVYEAIQDPTSYNTSKLFAEQYLRDSGIKHSIIRYFNIYGPGQKKEMVIPRFISRAVKNREIVVFSDGDQTRDFTYIDDAIKATILIAEKTQGKTIDIGTGKESSIMELAENIKQILRSSSPIIKKEPPENRLPFEIRRRKSDPRNLEKMAGFRCATTLKKGLLKTIRAFQR